MTIYYFCDNSQQWPTQDVRYSYSNYANICSARMMEVKILISSSKQEY